MSTSSDPTESNRRSVGSKPKKPKTMKKIKPVPVYFEYGMDKVECELYYALRQAGNSGGSISPLKVETDGLPPRPRRPTTLPSSAKLVSCLREPKRALNSSTHIASSRWKDAGRSSFTAMPWIQRESKAERSQSVVNIDMTTLLAAADEKSSARARRVRFADVAEQVLIPCIDDIPRKVRANLWLTRKELDRGVQQAIGMTTTASGPQGGRNAAA